MDLIEFNWPQSILGPKLLSRTELIEIIISYTLWNSDESFIDRIQDLKKDIENEKIFLNSLYSYQKRLSIPAEFDKLYAAYIKKLEKENYRRNEVNKILNTNCKKISKLIEENTTQLNNGSVLGLCNFNKFDIQLSETKTSWLNIEKIHTVAKIDASVTYIKMRKKEIHQHTKQYNKLKNQLMK